MITVSMTKKGFAKPKSSKAIAIDASGHFVAALKRPTIPSEAHRVGSSGTD